MKVLTPIKAIRAYFIECSGGMVKEVKLNQKNSRPYHYEFDREFISPINYSCSSQSAIS